MTKKEIQIQIGKRIRQLREERNIPQVEFASMCNFEKSNLSRLESGNTNPTAYTLYIISKNLEISLVEIFKEIK